MIFAQNFNKQKFCEDFQILNPVHILQNKKLQNLSTIILALFNLIKRVTNLSLCYTILLIH
jgi:hypothetical protein